MHGSSEKYWQNSAVFYAEITKIDTHDGRDTISFRPVALLGGSVDPSAYPEITATTWFGPEVSAIEEKPAVGAKAIILVEHFANWFVPNGGVDFLPDHVAICPVTGFDDPKVTETIENLRKLRGKQREEAEKAAAEKAQSGKNSATSPAAK